MTENGSATSRGLCRPHPEERACASASAKSNARARVSKDEDGHGMALMLRDASQPQLRCGRMRACLGCDAPQHEGARAAHFGKAKRRRGREQATCGCEKRPSARFPCFRPVLYRERRNSNVSSVDARSAEPHPSGVGPRAERRHRNSWDPRRFRDGLRIRGRAIICAAAGT
jgi:hypothetical protein